MFSPDGMLASQLFHPFATGNPVAARNLANLILLAPGYFIELGFYLAILFVYMVPRWRGGRSLAPAQRSLVFIAAVTLVMISFLRSSVLTSNDFGWRAALLMQFPLLLLAVDPLIAWGVLDGDRKRSNEGRGLHNDVPGWFRSFVCIALVIGICNCGCQVLVLRFTFPFDEWMMRAKHAPDVGRLSHNAYISYIGYAKLDAAIPRDAIVQYNPSQPDPFLTTAYLFGIDRQTAIAGDQLWCGSELGGDPSGCPAMAVAIDALFSGAAAEQARATCRAYNIDYLVANIYDAAWQNKAGWVWTLRPVVSQEEFRALDCRH
jgi:hypothetical protein